MIKFLGPKSFHLLKGILGSLVLYIAAVVLIIFAIKERNTNIEIVNIILSVICVYIGTAIIYLSFNIIRHPRWEFGALNETNMQYGPVRYSVDNYKYYNFMHYERNGNHIIDYDSIKDRNKDINNELLYVI